MLKTLLKKQLLELNRSFFYDQKKGKSRSKASSALFIALYALLMVGVLGGVFTMLAVSTCGALLLADMGWLYFLLFSMISVMLGVFGSVFNTYSALYMAKDNDLLLSMPIPTRYILITRLLGVYLMGLMFSAVVIVPAVIVYLVVAPLTLSAVVGCLLLVVQISVLVLILSCALGWVVAKISLKLKNKSFITVIISLAFFAVYYFVCFRANQWISQFVANAAVYGEAIMEAAHPLYVIGRMGEGDWSSILLVVAVTAALFVLTWRLLSRSFIGIATATGQTVRVKYKRTAAKEKSVSGAMLGKELDRFFSSPNYMLNCGLGTVVLPIAGVVLLIKGGSMVEILNEIFAARAGCAGAVICGIVCAAAGMNDMAVPSVSLEGKSLWIAQSLPVSPWIAVRAKLRVHLLLTGIPALFCAVCGAIVMGGSIAESVLTVAFAAVFILLSACFGLMLGILKPNLTWTSEIVPIKQSGSIMVAMLVSWLYALAFAGLYIWAGWKLGLAAYLAIAVAVTSVLAAAAYRWLHIQGSDHYAHL